MTEPNTYATAFPRDEQWGEFLPWREKVGNLPPTHNKDCCSATGEAPRADGKPTAFLCCREIGHDGPHVACYSPRICAIWEDPS